MSGQLQHFPAILAVQTRNLRTGNGTRARGFGSTTLVFPDVDLPGMSGHELARRLRNQSSVTWCWLRWPGSVATKIAVNRRPRASIATWPNT